MNSQLAIFDFKRRNCLDLDIFGMREAFVPFRIPYSRWTLSPPSPTNKYQTVLMTDPRKIYPPLRRYSCNVHKILDFCTSPSPLSAFEQLQQYTVPGFRPFMSLYPLKDRPHPKNPFLSLTELRGVPLLWILKKFGSQGLKNPLRRYLGLKIFFSWSTP